MSIVSHIIRFAVSAAVLLLVGYIVPGFDIRGFWTAVLAAVVIASIGYIIESFFGGLSPYGRGLIGFLSSSAVIYITKFIIPGVYVTILGALLSSLVIGIIDLFLPSSARFWTVEK